MRITNRRILVNLAMAAAVSGCRLYHAEVVSSASANVGDKKAGTIEIVTKLVAR